MAVATQDYAAKGVRWDLSFLFESTTDPAVEASWQRAHLRADDFTASYRGKIESQALDTDTFLTALKEYEELSNEAVKPVLYANLLFAGDTGDATLGAFLQEQTEKLSELRVKLMFFELEIQEANDEYLDQMVKSGSLDTYSHYLYTTRAFRPHKLSEAEEVILEETSNTGCRAWTRFHEELTSNHMFPFLDPETSETSDLTQEEILDLLRDPKRDVRAAAANGLSQGLEELERAVVYTYNTLLADKKLEDRLRRFESPESSRHLSNELDKSTVDLVMNLCKERSDLVARYYRTKKRLMDCDELTHIDRYAPISETSEKKTWAEAQAIVLDSFNSFSPTMANAAREFFEKSWIDAEPRKGKSGGAFCSPNTPDTHPVLFQTYQGKLNDVMTLAHEMGHGVHAYMSREQTSLNFNGTLPLAELASIFAEMVTFEKLVSSANHEDKIVLYAEKIEGIFATVHRQAAMFRFEQRCHIKRRQDGELTAEEFHAIWQEEMQSMFGDSLKLGEQHRRWWIYVSHFIHTPFYVYAYSFGELLTLSLYQLAKAQGPSFESKYLSVLRLGGSRTPQELMAILDVDLKSKDFWLGGFKALEGLVAEFENLVGPG